MAATPQALALPAPPAPAYAPAPIVAPALQLPPGLMGLSMRELLRVLVRAAWATPQGAITSSRLSEEAIRTGWATRAKEIMGKVATELETAAAAVGLGTAYQTVWGTVGRPPRRKKR